MPLRCRVLEVLNDNNVRIYALDLGQTFVVEISELKIISDYLASVPARVSYYGANELFLFICIMLVVLLN